MELPPTSIAHTAASQLTCWVEQRSVTIPCPNAMVITNWKREARIMYDRTRIRPADLHPRESMDDRVMEAHDGMLIALPCR